MQVHVLLGFPSQSVRSKNTALLFLHGSFHGSWCWQEHFLPYFVDAGYTVVAPDWRGTGGYPAAPGARKVKVAQHVQDLSNVSPTVLKAKNSLSSLSLKSFVCVMLNSTELESQG